MLAPVFWIFTSGLNWVLPASEDCTSVCRATSYKNVVMLPGATSGKVNLDRSQDMEISC